MVQILGSELGRYFPNIMQALTTGCIPWWSSEKSMDSLPEACPEPTAHIFLNDSLLYNFVGGETTWMLQLVVNGKLSKRSHFIATQEDDQAKTVFIIFS
jgi:hypothetical protein